MTEPKTLLILAELLRRLRLINAGLQPTKFFTTPGVVELGPQMGDLRRPGPAIFVEISDWQDQKMMASQHEATITILVKGFVEHSTTPQEETHRLAYDIVKVFGEADADSLLTGTSRLVMSIGADSYTSAFEFFEQSGRGEVVVTARATYRWTHSAP